LAGSFPLTIELLLEEYDQHLDGKRRLSEILAGFLDLEEAADLARKEKEAAALLLPEPDPNDETEADDDETATEDEEEPGPTGPDPAARHGHPPAARGTCRLAGRMAGRADDDGERAMIELSPCRSFPSCFGREPRAPWHHRCRAAGARRKET